MRVLVILAPQYVSVLHFEPSQTFPPSPHWNANLCYVRSVAVGELCRESNPRVTFHRPTGTLTVLRCVVAGLREFCAESNPRVTFHRPIELALN